MKRLQENIESLVEDRALYNNVYSSYNIIKRIFDIITSAIAILVLLPVFVIFVVIIRIDSPGPIFFGQERIGFKGKTFKMYKFRSMISNAEQILEDIEDRNQVAGHMFKIKDDPRITRVGRFIRKTSIDELPQLFNILKGDMSFVGPRPPLVREVIKYDKWHNLRMSVRPGLTGLWQVSGRNLIGFDEMVRLDLKYIRERSFWYDLKIIIKTIPVIFGDKNAF